MLFFLAASAVAADGLGHGVDWVVEHAHEFDPSEGPDGAGMRRVVDSMRGYRVVGLGEATHGTREFFTVRGQLIQALARDRTITVALEACPAAVEAVNRYVLFGEGDAAASVAKLEYWTLATAEMVEVVDAARTWNQGHASKIQFVGIDIADPRHALTEILAYARAGDHAELAGQAEALRDRVGASHTAVASIRLDRSAIDISASVRISAVVRGQLEEADAGVWCSESVSGVVRRASSSMEKRAKRAGEGGVVLDFIPQPGADWIECGGFVLGSGVVEFQNLALSAVSHEDGQHTWAFAQAMAASGEAESEWRFEGPGWGFGTSGANGETLRVSRAAPSPEEDVRIARQMVAGLESRATDAQRGDDAGMVRYLAEVVLGATAAEQQRPSGRYAEARDEAMAHNVAEVVRRFSDGGLVVVWAHNGHVGRIPRRMGALIAKEFGGDYGAIALTTSEGSFAGFVPYCCLRRDNRLRPRNNSIEMRLEATGFDGAFLSLAEPDQPIWLRARHVWMRDIGALVTRTQFMLVRAPEAYDSVLWLRNTTASSPLELAR